MYPSLSARRAWIEINIACATGFSASVALRKESVDRNRSGGCQQQVALDVALRKESVDRNVDTQDFCVCVMSLSARRAWIEIGTARHI